MSRLTILALLSALAMTSTASDEIVDLQYVHPDSVWAVLEAIEIVAEAAPMAVDPTAGEVDPVAIRAQDPLSAADLAPLLPATSVAVNSRGESQFMVRGAPERHVRLLFDGIPLNVPWDERVDASLVPIDAVGAVRATRGVASVLDGPGALAGVVAMQPLDVGGRGHHTRLGVQAGESGLWEGRLLHQRASADWQWLAAGSWRRRDGSMLPSDVPRVPNQTSFDLRTNTDLEQASLLLRAERRLGRDGSWHVTLLGTDGEKGVAPELHRGARARFWRYPEVERALAGFGLDAGLDGDGRWRLGADLSADVFHQEIRAFDGPTYTSPALVPGVEYETDHDRTANGRLRLTRALGQRGSLAVQGSTRYSHHRESLLWQGPKADYSQLIVCGAAEADLTLAPRWRLRAGAGVDRASSPETGGQPSQEPIDALAALLRVEHRLTDDATLHGAASRRSRFPALRELYSTGLGKFAPNPGLEPERQDLAEVGVASRGRGWDASLTGFASHVDQAIEIVELQDGSDRQQRVNLDAIRVLGVELAAAWRPHPDWNLAAHHTILDARRRQDGEDRGAALDRPNTISFATVEWNPLLRTRLALEAQALGPRTFADVTEPAGEDGLKRLPAQGTFNARLSRVFLAGTTLLEAHLRVLNLLDARVDSQVGLPEPGRTLLIGLKVWHDGGGG